MAIRSNLRLLHSQKEANDDRRIPYSEVADNTGMTKAQVSRYMNNQVKLFHADTIEKLCLYYGCIPGDLIVMVNNSRKGAAATKKAT